MTARSRARTTALAIIFLCGLWGGAAGPLDSSVFGWVHTADLHWPWLVQVADWITNSGTVDILVPAAVLAAIALLLRGRRVAAILVIAIPVTERVAVDLLKWVIDRPRPNESYWLANAHSMSFPSGHAANSMATWLTIALLLAPQAYRLRAAAAAIAISIAVGLSRIVLQVHWLTDVIAGWMFGLVWVAGWMRLTGRGTWAAPVLLSSGKESMM